MVLQHLLVHPPVAEQPWKEAIIILLLVLVRNNLHLLPQQEDLQLQGEMVAVDHRRIDHYLPELPPLCDHIRLGVTVRE